MEVKIFDLQHLKFALMACFKDDPTGLQAITSFIQVYDANNPGVTPIYGIGAKKPDRSYAMLGGVHFTPEGCMKYPMKKHLTAKGKKLKWYIVNLITLTNEAVYDIKKNKWSPIK